MARSSPRDPLRRAVAIVAALNLGYFGVEFAVALTIGSVSLLGDSIDFLEDALINVLIAIAIAAGARDAAPGSACCSRQASRRSGWRGESSERPCRPSRSR